MKEILLTSSVLILALTVLRRFFGKHVSKRFQYGLWALVLLRLLIPVQFGSLSFSVTSLAQDSEPIAAIEHQISQPIAKPDYEVIYQNVVRDYQNQGYDVSKPEIVTQITQITEEKMALPTWEEVLKILWFAGMGAMAVWFTLVNLRFRRSARKNALRLDAESPIPVYVSEGVSTPCLTGLFRPVIYLTPACAEDPRLRRHALIHELTHFRHGDHIWSLLRSLCLCVYWFNPLVWLAAILSRRDCELACDEGVLKRLGEEERLGYGRSLVDVVAGDLSPRHLLETATAMNESKRQITERVNRIVKRPKLYFTAAVCLLLAAALIAGCAFAGKVSKPEPQKSDYLLLETLTQIHAYDGAPEKVIWEQNTYDQYGHLTRTAKSEEGRMTISKIECDAKGNVTKITNQDADGVTTTWSKLTYSNDGYLLSDREYAGSDLQASEVQSKEYTYDENGNELTYKHSVGDFVYETVKTYDDAGNILSIAAGSSLMRYTYDSDGRLIHLVTYNNGKEERQEKYTYSDGGRTCTVTIYDGSSVELGKTIQTKSADGRSVEVLMLLADGTEEQRTNSIYDEDGNCIFEQIFKQGRLYMTTVSRYCKPGQQAAYTLTYVPGDAVTDAQLYPFPGTAWGMTPEEAIKALGLKKGEYTEEFLEGDESGDFIVLSTEGVELFGITADVRFQFSDYYTPGTYRLAKAYAGLPADTDFDALRGQMALRYGMPEQKPTNLERWVSPIAYYDLMNAHDREQVEQLSAFQDHYTEPGNICIQLSVNSRYNWGVYQGEPTNHYIEFTGCTFQFSEEGMFPTVPESTEPQSVPEDFSEYTLVNIGQEERLSWGDDAGNTWNFYARIPELYPFSEDALAINQQIAESCGAIIDETKTAAAGGYSPYYLSVDFKAYLNDDLLSLVITHTTDFDYTYYRVYNFRLQPGEYAVTMDTAAMAKRYYGLSYPEFLWAAKEFSLAYFDTEYGAADKAMLEDFKNLYLEFNGMPMGDNPMNLSSGNLFMHDSGTMMLVFDAYSMAGADYYPTIAPFTPGPTDKAESYHWLFNIHADGAYATAHDNIFTNAFLANPKEFAQYVALEPEETIARVAQGIGFEGGVVYADTIREALNSLAESTFKTLTLETLDNHWPET